MAEQDLRSGSQGKTIPIVLKDFLERLREEGYSDEQLKRAGREWVQNYSHDMTKPTLDGPSFDSLEQLARQVLAPDADEQQALRDAIAVGAETDPEGMAELTASLTALDDGFNVADADLVSAEDAPNLGAYLGQRYGLDALSTLAADETLGDGSEATWMMGGGDGGVVDLERASAPLPTAAPRLSLSDPLQNEQARIGQELDALGDGLMLPPEQPVPTYRNEEAAARLAARQQAAPTETITEAAGETPGGGFWDSVTLQDKLGLGLGLAGSALGVVAPMLERDKKFEGQLRDRAGGDTIARREGALAAGQLARGIRGASLGRRDISPALAMRNAQMAAARAGSDVMAQAAIASARERQAAQQQLADIRKSRIQTQINAGLGALSATGAWLSSQGAAQKQDARAQQQLGAAQERNRLQAEQNKLFAESLQGRGKR
jgi:hypothetical protein